MKSLFAVLVAAVVAAGAYWKSQYPDASLTDMQAQAGQVVQRFSSGVTTGIETMRASQAGIPADVPADATTLASSENSTRTTADIAASADSVSAVNDERLVALESTLASLQQQSSEQAAAASEISALATRLAATQSQIEELKKEPPATTVDESMQGAIEAAVSTAVDSAVVAAVDSALEDAVGTAVSEAVDGAVSTAMEQQTSNETSAAVSDEVNAKFGALDDQIAGLATRLDTLSAGLSGGKLEADSGVGADAGSAENAAAGSGENATADSDADDSEADADTTAVAADAANTAAKKGIAQLAAQLDTRFAALEKRQSEDREQLTSIGTSLDDMTASIGQLRAASDSSLSIDTVQSAVQEQLAALENRVNNGTVADVATLTNSLQVTREQIDSLETRVQNLPEKSNEAEAASELQSALEAQIAALEERIATAATQSDPNLVSTLSEVQAKVSELAAKSFVTREDLRTQQAGRTKEYKVYFDINSATVSDAAARVLNSFITQEQNRATAVSIYGFTDRRGDAAYNQQLALQRAANVRSYLIQNGFNYTKIKTISGLGEDAAAATLDDGAEDAGQRAVVLFAAQP